MGISAPGITPRRIGALAIASAVGFVLPLASFTGNAAASNTVKQSVKVTQSNWYWESPLTLPVANPLPIALPDNPIPAGILIPSGDLAVSLTNAATHDVDRTTYLQFATGSANATAKVTSFTFTVKVDPANLTNYPPGAQPALVACYPSRAWDGGPGSTSYAKKPQELCEGAPAGKYDAKAQTYTFQVKSFAQDWVGGTNLGVAIVPSATQATPFILALKGPKTVAASISYVQGVAVAAPTVKPTTALPVALPDVTPAQQSTVSEPVSVAIPVTPTQPVVSTSVPNAFTAASGTRVIGETSYDSNFWLSLLAAVVGIGLVGWFMGRRPAPVAVRAESSRLTQVLAARAALGATRQ